MLESLGHSNDNTKFVLIKDNVKQSGHALFRAILQNSLQGSTKVTVILYETRANCVLPEDKLEHYQNNGLNICHPGPDYCDDLSFECSSDPVKVKDPFENFREGSLFLDTLNPLLVTYSVPQLYRALHKLLYSSQVKQVVILAHSDTQDDSQLATLEHLSSLVISLSPPDARNPLAVRAHITGCPVGKKIINKHESFTVDNDGFIHSAEIKPDYQSAVTPLQVDLSNLTFNLGIKEDEMVARERLVLPYTQVRSSKPVIASGGEIFYEPDEVDDFDEEDPDNDLNI